MKIKEMLNIRANQSQPTVISSDGEFFNTFIEYMRANSSILDKSIVLEGNPQQVNYFDIENSSNFVFEGSISSQFKPLKSFECNPKLLVSEFSLNRNRKDIFFEGMNEEQEKQIFENILYKPLLRSIEKNVIQDAYFDKSIQTIITTESAYFNGTHNFNNLLKLVRILKQKNENNIIIIHPDFMSMIIDTITNESYLNEYLLKGTIEGIKIVETLECQGSDIFGVDPTKICLTLCPDIQIRKINSMEFPYNYFYQLFGFANGGDMFNTGYGMRD